MIHSDLIDTTSLTATQAFAYRLKQQSGFVASKIIPVVNRIWSVVKTILAAGMTIAAFILCPYFFAGGAFGGFLITAFAPKQVPKVIATIQALWQKLPWLSFTLVGLGAFFALPVTLAASSMLWGAYVGSALSFQAQSLLNQ
jgi:hypothetical protein